MSLTKILEDWSDYDNMKQKGQDSDDFSCAEAWELAYLLNKIQRQFPDLRAEVIRQAIEHCCVTVNAPRPRKEFVSCVLRRLGKSLVV